MPVVGFLHPEDSACVKCLPWGMNVPRFDPSKSRSLSPTFPTFPTFRLSPTFPTFLRSPVDDRQLRARHAVPLHFQAPSPRLAPALRRAWDFSLR